MSWLQYLVEANIYLSVFYLCYCLFLRNETHYTLNRVYLLFSYIISFIIPLLQIGLLKPVEALEQSTAIIPGNIVYVAVPGKAVSVAEVSHFTLQDGLLYAYVLGVAICMLLMAVKLYKLFRLSKTKNTVNADGYKLVYINESNTAFSFFNYLFIGTKAPGAETIIRHELVHINQKHSVDIVLLEFFKIINWFNPLIYLLQNSLKTVHEYIADEQTAANDGDTLTYSSFLVDNAYGISGSSITHSFFNYNLLKKRIIMLNQQRSGSLARLKYLIIAPLCAGLLCVSTLAFSKTYGWVDLAPTHELNTVHTTDTTFLLKPKTYVNEKGFLINEKYYTVNGKKYFRTIISATKGKKMPDEAGNANKITLYLGLGNASGEEMIYHYYGYKFPNVEVTPQTIGPPPPPPMIVPDKGHKNTGAIDTRNALSLYASNHIVYPKAAIENEITGTVVAKFNVDAHHKIKDIEIVNSLGYGCKEQVINMLKSYPGVINDKYNEYLTAISFDLFGRTKNYALKRHSIDPKIENAPNFILGLGITAYGPNTKSIGKIVPPPPPPAPPKNKMGMVKFPPPVVKYDVQAADEQTPVRKVSFKTPAGFNSTTTDEFEGFYKQLIKTIRYPKEARENNYAGRVIAGFTIDAANRIQDIRVYRGASQSINEELVRALQACDASGLKPGKYALPVFFALRDKDDKYTGDIQDPASYTNKYAPRAREGSNEGVKMLKEVVVTGYEKNN
jgi:hypothetical protein